MKDDHARKALLCLIKVLRNSKTFDEFKDNTIHEMAKLAIQELCIL